MATHPHGKSTVWSPVQFGASPGDATLVIGDISRWQAQGLLTVPPDGFSFISLCCMTDAYFHQVAPDLVLSPLIGDRFDATDIAARLVELSFKGRYRAIAGSIPRTDLILRDIRQIAPDIDFDLLILPPMGALDRT